jgi:predicted AlkP superfamily pyrophosphatase or phosphodiesterase
VSKRSLVPGLCLSLFVSTIFVSTITFAAGGGENRGPDKPTSHVLLVSVDGLHALDVAKYIAAHPHSALAELASHGTTYSDANTPQNSDSFPGLLALVTGGSPVTSGLFYDVSYDRTIFDPTNITCTGSGGNMMVFDESIDKYDSHNVSLNVIDPAKLPHQRDANGNCVDLWPHSALRTNTIFEVVKASGGRTAWEDKHPAYDLVNGPSGNGVDDLYTPEVTNVGGLDNTHSVVCTVMNDQLKVAGIINEINGFTHDRKSHPGVPEVFGMNFQGVSVGQKLVTDNYDGSCVADNGNLNGQPGGYIDGSGTPTTVLSYALDQTDAALASMIQNLKDQNLYDSTWFIVTAKHGQSPINPLKANKPGHFADVVASLPDGKTNPAAIAITNANACATGPCGFVNDDDIALVWLADQTMAQQVRDYINTNAIPLFVDEVLGGDELKLRFNDPLKESRTPDIIVRPNYGTIYTTSTAKNAEHGGFNYSDTNVGLIVSNPSLPAKTVKSPVATSQVAPTILQALGIDPTLLKSVRVENTQALPGLGLEGKEH